MAGKEVSFSSGHWETEDEKRELDRLAVKAQEALRSGKAVSEVLTAEQAAALRERYSRFVDTRDSEGFLTGSTHLVTKVSTPRPYMHITGSNHPHERGVFGSFWDQSGAGFSCLDTVLAGPVTSHTDTSYVPTAPRPADHRSFYLREQVEDGGVSIWHAFAQRGMEERQYDSFSSGQGLGTVTLSSSRNELSARLLAFVPVDTPLEVWRLGIGNLSDRQRRLSLFLRINWGLESYPGYYFDPRVVMQGRLYEELSTLVALNGDQNNRHPRTGFLMSREKFDGFDMSGEDFSGGGHFTPFPKAVEQGRCTGSMGIQPYMGLIAAMQFDLILEPGETRGLDLLLGVTTGQARKEKLHLEGLRRYYFDEGGIGSELERLDRSWNEMICAHMVRTPDTETDRFFNVWSGYQAKNTARWTRALDKVGYRDLLQDLMSINSFDPEYTRTMLPVALRYQYPDGTAVRQFAKFDGAPHDTRMYMDSSSWIADTLVSYVRETGDFDILDREEPFLDPGTLRPDEDNRATVYEHAVRGIRALYERRGQKGLCEIGHGDWNDALDSVGRGGGGVSVWLSMAAVHAAGMMAGLAARRGDDETAALMRGIAGELSTAINESAWDGEYYVYAFLPDGTPVGSRSNEEGRIHLNVNAWSLFSGVAAAAGRVETVIESVERLRTPLGYLLLHPSYTEKSKRIGRIADMVPGQFENGSIYTHGQSFMACAFAELGDGERAFETVKQVLPENTLPDISTGPPHQISNYTVGIEHVHYGRNLYSNFSGALAWLRKTLDRMFGLLPDFDSLVIDPVIPSHWSGYSVEKLFRGCRVRARVSNPGNICRGVAEARLDGSPLDIEDGRCRVPLGMLSGREEAELDVTLG